MRFSSPSLLTPLAITLETAASLTPADLAACFDLVEATRIATVAASSPSSSLSSSLNLSVASSAQGEELENDEDGGKRKEKENNKVKNDDDTMKKSTSGTPAPIPAPVMRAAATMKWKEMCLPDMRYLLVRSDDDSVEKNNNREGSSTSSTAAITIVEAFLSFMLTYEDGHEVIYCYEIHLRPRLRHIGLGKYLLGLMEGVGEKVGVKKAMLTVVLANERAGGFYERMGYTVDEFSPEPRRLRGGVVKKPDYAVLSKPLRRTIQCQGMGNDRSIARI